MEEKVSFMCDVIRREKCIVSMHWETDWSPASCFKDVFLAIAPENVKESPVEIKVGTKLPNKDPGQWVSVRLDQCLKLISLQGGNFVRCILPAEGISNLMYCFHSFSKSYQFLLGILNGILPCFSLNL